MTTPKWDDTAELKAPSWDETTTAKVEISPSAPAGEPGWFQPGSQSEALVRGLSQGATLGFGDEAQAGIRAFLDSNKKPGESYVDAYRRIRDEERMANSSSAQANPGTYLAGTVAGSAPSTLIAPASGIAKVAGFNAIHGALAGVGNSDADVTKGDVAGAAQDAGVGAAVTAGLGAVGQGVGNLVQRTANGAEMWARRGVANTLGKSSDPLDKKVAGAILWDPANMAKVPKEYLEDALPSAINTGKTVVNTVVDNLKDTAKKGITATDLALGGVATMLGGPHVGIATVLGKKALIGASADAAKKHADQIGAAAHGMLEAAQQKFAPVVKEAMQKGTPFAAINNILQQQSPEYREMVRAQEKLKEEGEGQD